MIHNRHLTILRFCEFESKIWGKQTLINLAAIELTPYHIVCPANFFISLKKILVYWFTGNCHLTSVLIICQNYSFFFYGFLCKSISFLSLFFPLMLCGLVAPWFLFYQCVSYQLIHFGNYLLLIAQLRSF